ncbi:MAG: tyrosine-type recombinase/integrase [Spirochaetes bacterium]|nr:tyrosine-type recombinase/integrase [Spirochaetota bacterium]
MDGINLCNYFLRHSEAIHLLRSGVNLVYIRERLGHIPTQTTEIYARADHKQKQEVLEKASANLFPEMHNKNE